MCSRNHYNLHAYIYKRNCHYNWQFVIPDSSEWAQFITMWRRTMWHVLSQLLPHYHTILAINCVHALISSLIWWRRTMWHILSQLLPHYHTILAINCVHALISSLICNEHDKLMAKMSILFLLYACTACMVQLQMAKLLCITHLHLYDGSKLTTCVLNYVTNMQLLAKNLSVPGIYWSSSH